MTKSMKIGIAYPPIPEGAERTKRLEIEIVYPMTMTGAESKKSSGLRIDGVFLNWQQVETQYDLNNWVFMKRLRNNPTWTLQEILLTPKYNLYKGLRVTNQSRTRQTGLSHTPEQLADNKVACGRWR